jgi:hypothetical protein
MKMIPLQFRQFPDVVAFAGGENEKEPGKRRQRKNP